MEAHDAAPAPIACPAMDARAALPFATCDAKVVKTPVPGIEDPGAALRPFYDKLAALERGTATRPVRIGMYGDSNLTSDFLSGQLRRVLQERYGDAGHGWVSLSRPWGSYRHEDVVSGGFWDMFKMYAPTTHVTQDKEYGFANMAAQSSDAGAAVWAATTQDPKARVGTLVSRFELHYLRQPHGGAFTIQIDKKDVKTVETRADAFGAGIETLDVEEGSHEMRAVVKGTGPVRFFGVSLDRPGPPARPGIQLDSLGAGSLSFRRLVRVAEDVRRPQLAARAYDLIVIWLGMNVMFVPPNEAMAKEFIQDLRDALPATPILILSPSDTVKDGETRSDPRIVAVVKQMRKVAADTGSAFWDFREAMGGDASVLPFTQRGLVGEDHIHFGREGGKLMANRLLCAMTASFGAHLAAHPDAGCPQ